MQLKQKKSPLKKCVDFLKNSKLKFSKDEKAYPIRDQIKGYEIIEDSFHPIPSLHKDKKKMGFVDGGSSSLITSSDLDISFNRVAGCLFKGQKPLELNNIPTLIEYYTATIIDVQEDGKLKFIIKSFPREEEHREFIPDELTFFINDESIREQFGYLPKIEQMGGIVMRFSEWIYGKHLIENELDSEDIFIRDGSLQTGYTNEIKEAEKLFSIGSKKNVYITGLSKSCRLITDKGNSLISVVNALGNNKISDSPWYFYPSFRITRADNQADVYFVKLHKHATHSFRFDIFLEQSQVLKEQDREIIISNIAYNSTDLSFPGYPYGLIKADQLARISMRELDSQKIALLSEFDQDIYKTFIIPRLRSMDAHDIINKIRK
ncbi:MAG: hypothetical protein ACQERB_09045 [Promethearchaeati archaeon]